MTLRTRPTSPTTLTSERRQSNDASCCMPDFHHIPGRRRRAIFMHVSSRLFGQSWPAGQPLLSGALPAIDVAWLRMSSA